VKYLGSVVSDDLIAQAAKALANAAGGPARVILFGSRARGTSANDSDVDLLVIKRDVHDRFDDSVRLSRLAAELRVPADVVVVSEAQLAEWGHLKGTMLHDALAEGRVLAEA
jgi:predicted nucleotidyltransferase